MARKPRQGLLPFDYVPDNGGEEITAWSGLPVLIELMKQLGIAAAIDKIGLRQRSTGFSAFELVSSFALLLAAGGECCDDIVMLRNDKALTKLLGFELPSPSVLLRTLEQFHDEELVNVRPPQGAFIPPESDLLMELGGLYAVQTRAWANNSPDLKRATLDHDATVIESHKREALPHYKGGRGYQPVAVLWAETGLVVADQFRDGNVPAGYSNIDTIERALSNLPVTITERFFRADSACYEQKVLQFLVNNAVGFAISADMTRELRAVCGAVSESQWQRFETRSDVDLDIAEVAFAPGDWHKSAAPLRYITLRIRQTQGSLFADGSHTKYWAVVSNLDWKADEILDWHRKKAGTIEQLHHTTKNELGAGVLPSGKFGANAAWYRLVLFTHNLLQLHKNFVAPPELRDAQPKRLRLRLFALPARVFTHARWVFARVAAWALELADVLAGRRRLLALAPS